jgi:hypothetical protein
MKKLFCLVSILFSLLLNAADSDYKAHVGEVTDTIIRGTRLYKVGGITVARGGVKYVRAFVGQKIAAFVSRGGNYLMHGFILEKSNFAVSM